MEQAAFPHPVEPLVCRASVFFFNENDVFTCMWLISAVLFGEASTLYKNSEQPSHLPAIPTIFITSPSHRILFYLLLSSGLCSAPVNKLSLCPVPTCSGASQRQLCPLGLLPHHHTVLGTMASSSGTGSCPGQRFLYPTTFLIRKLQVLVPTHI